LEEGSERNSEPLKIIILGEGKKVWQTTGPPQQRGHDPGRHKKEGKPRKSLDITIHTYQRKRLTSGNAQWARRIRLGNLKRQGEILKKEKKGSLSKGFYLHSLEGLIRRKRAQKCGRKEKKSRRKF